MGKDLIQGFSPIASKDAEILILGSMPGVASLQQQQYYGHARNGFWPIIQEILQTSVSTYEEKISLLESHHIALWDVLKYCEREGSLDSSIVNNSMIVNDIPQFLKIHPNIAHIFLNGTKAEACFIKYVVPKISIEKYHVERLPSTSPANARMPFDEKLSVWKKALKKESSIK